MKLCPREQARGSQIFRTDFLNSLLLRLRACTCQESDGRARAFKGGCHGNRAAGATERDRPSARTRTLRECGTSRREAPHCPLADDRGIFTNCTYKKKKKDGKNFRLHTEGHKKNIPLSLSLFFLNGDVYSDNRTHARKNRYSSDLQLSHLPPESVGGPGLVEHTNLSPRHVSLVVVKGAGGDEGSGGRRPSQGFGQSSLQSPVLATKKKR